MTEDKLPPAEPTAPILDAQEAAHLLRVSKGYLYAMIRNGQGPRQVRVGKRVLFRRADLLAWADSKLVS